MRFRLIFSLVFSLSCTLLQAQESVTISLDGKRECGDTCALTISRGLGGSEVYLCDSEDMISPSRVPVCIDIFGFEGNLSAKISGRTASLKVRKERGSDIHYWIVGGSLVSVGSSSFSPARGESLSGEDALNRFVSAGLQTRIFPNSQKSLVAEALRHIAEYAHCRSKETQCKDAEIGQIRTIPFSRADIANGLQESAVMRISLLVKSDNSLWREIRGCVRVRRLSTGWANVVHERGEPGWELCN